MEVKYDLFMENSNDVPLTIDLLLDGRSTAGYYKVPGEKDNRPVIIRRSGENFAGFSSVCPHKQCIVGITESTLRCPCHGSQFDLVTGHVTLGPANSDLEILDIHIEGNAIQISIESEKK
jgi:nitrite reductase/ring-hydroxylating ferredoxin subunit